MTMNTLKIREMYLQPGRPKIAIPVVSTDPAEIKNECVEITDMPCDMIEWRADKYLSAVPDLEEKLKQKEFYLDSVKLLDDINLIAEDIPIIFTIRSRSQGGDVQLSEEHMAGLRGLAAQSGLVDMVDIELLDGNGRFNAEMIKKQVDEVHSYGCKVIMSHHDFTRMPTPEQMVSIVKTMVRMGADVCKLAAMSFTKEDTELLLKTTAYLNRNIDVPIVMIAMGEAGRPARVAAGKYGSCITFAAGLDKSAPGQVDAYAMKKMLDDYYGREEK